jgi:hypothetical protein
VRPALVRRWCAPAPCNRGASCLRGVLGGHGRFGGTAVVAVEVRIAAVGDTATARLVLRDGGDRICHGRAGKDARERGVPDVSDGQPPGHDAWAHVPRREDCGDAVPAVAAELGYVPLRCLRCAPQAAQSVGPDAGHPDGVQLGAGLIDPLAVAHGDDRGAQRHLPGDRLLDAGQGTRVTARPAGDGVVLFG